SLLTLLSSLRASSPMTSGRLASLATRNIHRLSSRANSQLHVGSNVKLRRCDTQPLEHVNVTVLHNGARANVIANLLTARGARLTHFVKEGSQVPDVEGQGVYVNLDCVQSSDCSTPRLYSRSELISSLKSADVFVDTSSKGVCMAPKDLVKINARLIYTAVQEEPSPFSSMRALAYISCALYGREKTSVGQVIILSDSAASIQRMEANQSDV
ncbi:hypothetical protein PENTCL1PPCAC_27596, partial [Pristionchus entomophagus]